MKKFKALAYVGVYELADLGTFETEQDALDALSSHLELSYEGDDQDEFDALKEIFWAHSQVEGNYEL